jgi:hypothetical protein
MQEGDDIACVTIGTQRVYTIKLDTVRVVTFYSSNADYEFVPLCYRAFNV